MSEFFTVVDWVGVAWLGVSAVFLGRTAAAVILGDAPRDGGSARPLVRALGVIFVIGALLALVLDEGPAFSPWWLQWLLLFAAPAVVTFAARLLMGSKRRLQPPASSVA